ncbi:MAG: hypothetical protein WKF97_00225 [Chitinophagaceae bacterium]
MLKKDNLMLGIFLGFMAPALGLIIYYFAAFYNLGVDFMQYIGLFKGNKAFLTGVSSISLVANAVVFTIYINGNRDQTAKGIFVATVIYAVTVLLIKFS